MNNVPTSDFFTYYANNVSMLMSYFDLAILFGEVERSENGELTVMQRMRVLMTPSHAKIFSWVLMHQVREWEKRFGDIVVPPDAVPPEIIEMFRESQEEHESKEH